MTSTASGYIICGCARLYMAYGSCLPVLLCEWKSLCASFVGAPVKPVLGKFSASSGVLSAFLLMQARGTS